MKNYSNYYSPVKDKILSDAEVVFNMQLGTNEGFDVIIDKVPCRAIVQNHLNGMNEFKEERVISCNKNRGIHRGSYVEFEGETYIIISDVDNHIVYLKAKMQKVNNVLTFKNSLNKTVIVPCIVTNLTLYSDGLETKTLTLLDGKRNIIIPLNDDTKDIFVQQRFIFNHNSIFSVSLIDDFSTNGLLKLTMIQDMFKSTDDKINNLADNSILPITISFPQTSYTINQYSTMQLNPIIKRGDEILILNTNYTVESVDNTGFVSVDNLGNVVANEIGEGKVICKLVDNSEIKCEVNIEVVLDNPVPVVNYLISGNSEIRKTTTNLYSCVKLINNVEDISASFNFTLDYNGLPTTSVTMTNVSSNSVKLKGNLDSGSVILRAEDSVTGVNTYKTIQLKNIYGN